MPKRLLALLVVALFASPAIGSGGTFERDALYIDSHDIRDTVVTTGLCPTPINGMQSCGRGDTKLKFPVAGTIVELHIQKSEIAGSFDGGDQGCDVNLQVGAVSSVTFTSPEISYGSEEDLEPNIADDHEHGFITLSHHVEALEWWQTRWHDDSENTACEDGTGCVCDAVAAHVWIKFIPDL